MTTVAMLHVKGTSERVPAKNKKLLNGKPLFLYTLEKVSKISEIDNVYLDTESDEIYEIAKNSGVEFELFKRDPKLADNSTTAHELFMNVVDNIPPADIYIDIFITSPFVKAVSIVDAINTIKNNDDYDSSVLLQKEKFYLWENGRPAYDEDNFPPSPTLPDTIIETTGFYVMKRDAALSRRKRTGLKPYVVYANKIEAIDINTKDDFELAEIVAKGMT